MCQLVLSLRFIQVKFDSKFTPVMPHRDPLTSKRRLRLPESLALPRDKCNYHQLCNYPTEPRCQCAKCKQSITRATLLSVFRTCVRMSPLKFWGKCTVLTPRQVFVPPKNRNSLRQLSARAKRFCLLDVPGTVSSQRKNCFCCSPRPHSCNPTLIWLS